MAHNQDDKKAVDPTLLKSLTGQHKDRVTKAIFSPSLKQVISSSNDGLILAWGLRPNARPNKFQGHTGAVTDVAINDRGTLIASCSRDHTVRIWENNAQAKDLTQNSKLKHSGPVKSIAFNSDGSLLVSAGDDKLVKIWDVEKRKFVQSFRDH
jgi:centriolar protein POC1